MPSRDRLLTTTTLLIIVLLGESLPASYPYTKGQSAGSTCGPGSAGIFCAVARHGRLAAGTEVVGERGTARTIAESGHAGRGDRADPGRGLLMGNRGCLHDADRRLGVARWRSKLWICCVLAWRGVQRDPMPPGRWTALFFLDEATALAAGHRPCGSCRRPQFLAFAEAWRRARGLRQRPLAAQMDAWLHAERVDSR